MRKNYLDGVRGWASVIVVLNHLVHNFLARAVPSLENKWLAFPTDGDLAVYVFFVISGFALSIGYFEGAGLRILKSLALRRYIRLTVPVFASSLIAFLILKSGAMHNLQLAERDGNQPWLIQLYTLDPSALGLLRFSLLDVYFNYSTATSYNPVLWTMSVELFGSMLVFGLLALFGDLRNRSVIYAMAAAILLYLNSPLLPFIAGIVLADLFTRSIPTGGRPSTVGGLALFVAGILGSVHGHTFQGSGYLTALALCIVAGLTLCPPLRMLMESKVSVALGKISFPLYLTHVSVICSLSCSVFILATDRGIPVSVAALYTFAVSIPVIALVAVAFYPVESLSVSAARRFSTLLVVDSAVREEKKDHVPAG